MVWIPPAPPANAPSASRPGDFEVDASAFLAYLVQHQQAAYDGGGFLEPSDVVGTVSHSAGESTGAVVESGSNANGAYTRFADGLQICTISGLSSSDSADVTWTFPAVFFHEAHPFRTTVTGAVATTIGARLAVGGLHSGAWIAVNALTDTNTRVVAQMHLVAIGRWLAA